jgi:hypothetical protein
MRLGLTLATVAVEIEEEREIDAEGEIDAAEGATNKAIRRNRSASFPPCSACIPNYDLLHCYNEIPSFKKPGH